MQKCSPRPATAVTVRHASRGASAGGHPPSDRCSWGSFCGVSGSEQGRGTFSSKGPRKNPSGFVGHTQSPCYSSFFVCFYKPLKIQKPLLVCRLHNHSLQTAQKQPWLADPWFRTRTLTLDGVPVLTRPPLPRGLGPRLFCAPGEPGEVTAPHLPRGVLQGPGV